MRAARSGDRSRDKGPVRLVHVYSSDIAIAGAMPYLRGALARGWEVHLLCPHGPNTDIAIAEGVRWKPLLLTRSLDFAGDVKGSVELLRDLARGHFDIVHTHNTKVGLIGRVLATVVRAPLIVHTLHGLAWSLETPEPKQTAYALAERFASLRTDIVLAQSREDGRTMIARHVVPEERVIHIGNGVKLANFDLGAIPETARLAVRAEARAAEGDVLFVQAGRLVQEKGFVELFEAFEIAHAEEPRVRLAVAGPRDREKADAVSDAVVDRATRAGVTFLGDRKDMPAIFAAADVGVLVSWREGIPRVLMEASSVAKPLLVSDIRGCKEIVTGPDRGLRVPVKDARAIAEAIVELARDPAARARMGATNSDVAREQYDIDRVVARVMAVYDDALRARGYSNEALHPRN